MSGSGLAVATEYADNLPAFASLAEAERLSFRYATARCWSSKPNVGANSRSTVRLISRSVQSSPTASPEAFLCGVLGNKLGGQRSQAILQAPLLHQLQGGQSLKLRIEG